MAFKLTKAEQATKDEILTQLHDTWDAYSSAVEKAKDFASVIAERSREEFDEKSEKWQESDRGHAANEWIEKWEDDGSFEVAENEPAEVFQEMPNEV